MTINGKRYTIDGTITMTPKARAVNAQVLWVSLTGERGAHYTLACYEFGQADLFRGIFQKRIAVNVGAC